MTMTAALVLAASAAHIEPGVAAEIIGKQEVTVKDGRLTPEALWAMGRIGSSSVSPDGKRIVYTVSYYSVKANKSHTVIPYFGRRKLSDMGDEYRWLRTQTAFKL